MLLGQLIFLLLLSLSSPVMVQCMALDSNGVLVPINGPGAVDLSVLSDGNAGGQLSMMAVVLLAAVVALV